MDSSDARTIVLCLIFGVLVTMTVTLMEIEGTLKQQLQIMTEPGVEEYVAPEQGEVEL